jgi:hypothetical protein
MCPLIVQTLVLTLALLSIMLPDPPQVTRRHQRRDSSDDTPGRIRTRVTLQGIPSAGRAPPRWSAPPRFSTPGPMS